MRVLELTDLVVGLLTIVSLIVGFYVVIKKWVINVAHNLNTNNGKTVGQYIESINGKLDAMGEIDKETISMASEALTRVKAMEQRFDAFLQGLNINK